MSSNRSTDAREIQERLTTVSYALEEIYKSQINFHTGMQAMVGAIDAASLQLGNILSPDQQATFNSFFKTFRRLEANPFAQHPEAAASTQLKQIQDHFFKSENGRVSAATTLDINDEVNRLKQIFSSETYAKSYSNSQTSMNNHAEFSNFLRQLGSTSNGKIFLDTVNQALFPKSMNDYLINPAQNVARYGILLKAVQSALGKLPEKYNSHANTIISDIVMAQQDKTFLSNIHLSFGAKGAIATDLKSLIKTPSTDLNVINIHHLINHAAEQIGQLVKPSTLKRANRKLNQINDILENLTAHLPAPTAETSALLQSTASAINKIKNSINNYRAHEAYQPKNITTLESPAMLVSEILLDARKTDLLQKQTPKEKENFSRMMENRAARAQARATPEPTASPAINPQPGPTIKHPEPIPSPVAVKPEVPAPKQSTSSIFNRLAASQPSAKAQIVAAKKSLRHVEETKKEAPAPQAPFADVRQQLKKTGLASWEESEKKEGNDAGPRSPGRR